MDKNVNAAQSRATHAVPRQQGSCAYKAKYVSGSLIGADGARLGETEAPSRMPPR